MNPLFVGELVRVASSLAGVDSSLHSSTPPVLPVSGSDTEGAILDSWKQNKWTRHQREVLCCSYRFFFLRIADLTRIFNTIFREDLRQCGFHDGIKGTSLTTQWHDMRARAVDVWSDVHLETPFSEKSGRWANIVTQIRKTAQELGIDVEEKTYDDIKTHKFGCRRDTKLPKTVQEAVSDAERPFSDTEEPVDSFQGPINTDSVVTAGGKVCMFCAKEGLSVSPTEIQGIHQLTRSDSHADRYLQHDATCHGQTALVKKLPSLLYRWYNTDSQGFNSRNGFVAGLFAERRGLITPPADYTSVDFDMMLESHLRMTPVASPVISTFATPLAPIHRALRNQEGAAVAVIATSEIDMETYSAEIHMKAKSLKIRKYRGCAEYLVWRVIPKSAIVSVIKISDLQRITAHYPGIGALLQLDVIASFKYNRKELKQRLAYGPGCLNRACGLAIGKLLDLLEIPENFIVDVGAKIAAVWRFRRDGTFEEYIDGVREGRGLPLSTFATPVPCAPSGLFQSQTRSFTFNSSDCQDMDYASDGPIVESFLDDEDDEAEEDEEAEEEESDDDDDGTPCPRPRPGGNQGLFTTLPGRETQSPMQLPTPTRSSGLNIELFNTDTKTWFPYPEHTKSNQPNQQAVVRLDVFNPQSRAWSPLLDQTGLVRDSHSDSGRSRENAIVIEDDDEVDNDTKGGVRDTIEGDNTDSDTEMDEVDTGPPEKVESSSRPMSSRVPSGDRFALERARINSVLGHQRDTRRMYGGFLDRNYMSG